MAACLRPVELRQQVIMCNGAKIPPHKLEFYRAKGYHPKITEEKVTVPCGKCEACLSNRAAQWSFRLEQELKHSVGACYFITLTYDEDHVPIENNVRTFNKEHVQILIKNIRNAIRPKPVKYFVVSEYGGQTFRPHYHMLLFNFPYDYRLLGQFPREKLIGSLLMKYWPYGQVDIGTITSASITYCTTYVLQYLRLPPDLPRPWQLQSQGLGKGYLTKAVRQSYIENLSSSIVSLGRWCKTPAYYTRELNDFDLVESAKREDYARRQRQNQQYYNWLHYKGYQDGVEEYKRKINKRLNKKHE